MAWPVFGDPVEDWQDIDFQQHHQPDHHWRRPDENFLGEVRTFRHRRLPIWSIAWRRAAAHGPVYFDRAASVPRPFSAGDHLRADFGALGIIEVTFEDGSADGAEYQGKA